MSNWLDNFAVRISRRLYENRGKFCPACGETDPLLLVKDGRCANCASRSKEEKHHILGKAFRKSREAGQAVIPVSPNAHRLLSDLQAGHPLPKSDDPDSREFLESQLWEFLAAVAELWLVLTYLQEKPDVVEAIPVLMLTPLLGLLLMNLSRLDLPELLARAKEISYAKQT